MLRLCVNIVEGIVIFIFTAYASYLFLREVKNNGKLPPGPSGWSIYGVLNQFKNSKAHLKYFEMSRKFGKIFLLKMGWRNVVILSDASIIRTAFSKMDFNGKPETAFYKILGGYGIINTQGQLWKEQRQFLRKCLMKVGIGRFSKFQSNCQSRIMVEVKLLIEYLKGHNGEPVDLDHGFTVAVSNVVCYITMSVRFNYNDRVFRDLLKGINEGFRLFGNIIYLNYFPFLSYFSYFSRTIRRIEVNKKVTHAYVQSIIDEHEKTFEETKMRDALDYYIKEIKMAERSGTADMLFCGKNRNAQVLQIFVDMYTAGMETTKTTLHWCMIYMLNFPDIAREVRAELDAVIGKNRVPKYTDLRRLPLTHATILEALRKSSVVPLGNPHATTQDVDFMGYKIPKNTEIIALLYAINNDPKLWCEPEKFNPRRFLGADGCVFEPSHFIPFGAGRRACLGESLAIMEIFSFFSNIMHHFDLRLPEGNEMPSLEGDFGITLTPKHYKVQLVERKVFSDND